MTDLVLHHCPNTRSATVRWMLEEVGAPYRVVPVDLYSGGGRTPEHLALNPFGKVPVLVADGVPMTEYMAMILYLADAFPQAGLTIPVGDPRRGPFLSWIFLALGGLEGAMLDQAFPRAEPRRGAIPYGELDTLVAVIEKGVEPGPWLLGDAFTAADVAIGSGVRWGLHTGGLPARPALAAYAERIAGREAIRRARALDAAMGIGVPPKG